MSVDTFHNPKLADTLIGLLPYPILVIGADDLIIEANLAAESFFQTSTAMMRRMNFRQILPFGSPVIGLIEATRNTGGTFNEYRVDLGTPRNGLDRIVDVFVAPAGDGQKEVALVLQERTIAEKIGRQMTHRGTARSISALGSMLAHEIKNPLSGIRGAAQLLELNASDEDRQLTQLICDETDRIVTLVDRFEDFADGKPLQQEALNIHSVLEHVKKIAQSGFARHIRFIENYDPSLPPMIGNRDQLIQVFLNLVKNAAEAIGPDTIDGTIELISAFRPGVRMSVNGQPGRVALPLEISVRDNGPGIPADLERHLFEPFFSTKNSGSGLGLALVAKIIGDHGGVIECETMPRRTTFRTLMPMHAARDGRMAELEN